MDPLSNEQNSYQPLSDVPPQQPATPVVTQPPENTAINLQNQSAAPVVTAFNPEVQKDKKGLSIAAFIIGCFGLLFFFVPVFGSLAMIAGIIIGILGLKSSKKIFAILGIIFCVIFLLLNIALTAGFISKYSEKLKTDTAKTDETAESVHVTKAGYKRVGEPVFGYIDLPDNFVNFKEIGGTPFPTIAFSTVTQSTIINIQYLPRQGTPEQHAAGLIANFESKGQTVSLDSITIDGSDAVDIYTTYPDGTMMHVYLIAEGQYLKYISVEYKQQDKAVAEEIINTYSLDK